MNKIKDTESGFITSPGTDCYTGSEIRDVEVINVTKTNIIACGRRYGRKWFLKALRKELRDSTVMRLQLQKEFEIHSRLRHPAVPQVVGLENVEGLGLCIVQEWIDGTTLYEILEKKKLSASERRRIIRELISAVAYLHSRGIVHRDIKPANVMISEIGREVVLTDFGLADTADYVEIKAPAGTRGFISPEQESAGGANPADDVYSLGIIMRAMVPGLRRLAAGCAGPVASRPKDAGELLKLIDSREKKPRIILWITASLLIVGFALLGLYRIRSLEKSSRAMTEHFGQLSNENTRHVAQVASLEDSLANVKGNLLHANEELEKLTQYDNLKQSAVNEGCRKLDNLLLQLDKEIKAESDSTLRNNYSDKLTHVMETAQHDIATFCTSLEKEGLTKEDIEIINSTLNIHFGIRCSDYQKKWIKSIYPEL